MINGIYSCSGRILIRVECIISWKLSLIWTILFWSKPLTAQCLNPSLFILVNIKIFYLHILAAELGENQKYNCLPWAESNLQTSNVLRITLDISLSEISSVLYLIVPPTVYWKRAQGTKTLVRIWPDSHYFHCENRYLNWVPHANTQEKNQSVNILDFKESHSFLKSAVIRAL